MAASGRDEDGGVVRGRCERGFEPVRRALAEILASGEEVGAALAVYLDGHPVLDLWGGYTDAGRTRPWERDTIVNLYSVGKAVTALPACSTWTRPSPATGPSSPGPARRGSPCVIC